VPDTLTDYIRQDLRARLGNSRERPEDLTLAALSERYQVSLTPVRRAVRDLIAEEFLSRQANGRLAVNPDRADASGKRIQPPQPPASLNDLTGALTSEVICMSLRGQEVFLREEATAARFGVGRTVLRQVFHRLAGKGLIEHRPRRGWVVRRFDPADMEAYLEVRVSLELKALQQARRHLVRADLQAMLRGNAPGGKKQRLDNRLHRYLIEKSGNPYIRDFFDRHGLYFTTLFDYAAPEARVVAAMARQHRGILRALLAGDWVRARQTLAHHIRSQRPVLQRLLESIGVERD
jgi:DNA-binding GntR family transcriptional regulator